MTKKMSNQKKVAAVVAAVLIVALLIGGTLAWTDLSQSITNRLRGTSDNDVVLHDDFESGVKKDVYVENAGENPIIVRVKFNEFLQIGNQVIVGGDPNDKDSWETHLFDQGGNFTVCDLETHKYFEWVMEGNDKIYKPGTGEIGYREYEEGQVFEDGTEAKPTLPANAPITMFEYMRDKARYDAEPNGRWILDSDGWAYWSKLLPPGEATNLLLENVITINNPDDNYYYAIDVILQSSNRTEAKDLKSEKASPDGNTPEGDDLIDYLSGQEDTSTSKKISSIRVKEGTAITEYEEGDTFNSAGLVLIVTYDNGEEVEVTTGFTYEPTDALTTDDTSVTIKYRGKEVPLAITVTEKEVPVTSEPEASEPEVSEPEVSEPEASEPESTVLEFQAPYIENPSYTPQNEDLAIWVYDTAGSTGAWKEVADRTNDIVLLYTVEGFTEHTDKYIKIRLDSILADTTALDTVTVTAAVGETRFKDSEIFIEKIGNDYYLSSKVVPTYLEFWQELPIRVTLNKGTKSADFTIVNTFFGGVMKSISEG